MWGGGTKNYKEKQPVKGWILNDLPFQYVINCNPY